MKKISLVLCVTLIMSCLGMVNVSATDCETLYGNNFEGNSPELFTNDTKSASYGTIEQSNVYGMGSVFRSSNDKSTVNSYPFSDEVYLLDDAEGYDKTEKNLYVATEFDVIPKSGEPGFAMFAYDTRSDGTTIVDLKFLSDNWITVTSKSENRGSKDSIRNTALCQFEYNKPYRIRMVFHVSDSEGKSCEQLTDVLVNGNSVIGTEKHYMKSNSHGKVDYYNTLRLFDANKMQVDNINVYRYTEGNEPVDKGGLVSLIRRSEDYISGSVNQDIIDAAKEEYESPSNTQKTVDAAAKNLRAEMHTFTLKGIVTEKDGKTGDFLYENGILSKVVLNKNATISSDSTLYAAFYSKEGVLQDVETANISEDAETGELEININAPLDVNLIDWSLGLFVMDDKLTPLMNSRKIVSSDRDVRFENVKVYDGSTKVRTDTLPMIYNNGEIYVPANNVINLLGMKLNRNGSTCTAVREDGKTLSFTVGSNTYSVNNANEVSGRAVELVDGYAPMIDADIIEKAFEGVEIVPGYDGTEAKLTINNSFAPVYQPLPTNITIVTENSHSPRDIKIILSGMSENDNPKVCLKLSANSMPDMSAFENSGKWSGNYKQTLDNGLYYYPKELKGLKYTDGKWIGYLGDMVTGGKKYDLIVEKGGTSYIQEEAVALLSGTDSFYPKTRAGSLYDTNGDLKLVPTYENIGYYFDNDTNAADATVTYKETSSSEYKTAYTPYYDSIGKQFRGSITGLKDNTEYTVRIELNDGTIKEKTVKTWNNNPTIGTTVKLSDIYTGGALTISNYHGNENSWIRIDGEGMTIDGTNSSEAVFIADSSYVIVENLKVTGGDRTGILVASSAENVRISNCDISGWGRRGVYDEGYMNYVADGGLVNYDAGIRMLDAKGITVEKCYIHDSAARTNSWKPDDARPAVHPQGSCGIYYQVDKGCVIRYNDIIGNDDHRFNDAIEGMDNTANYGGAARDTDIYGNMIFGCEDDGVELDGGQMNVRFYNNRIEQTLCGVSTAPQGFGPAYIYRNLITNSGTTLDNYSVGTGIKAGGTTSLNMQENGQSDMGTLYIFNNTIDADLDPIKNVGITISNTNIIEYHANIVNNILVSRKASGVALKNTYANISKDIISNNMTYGTVDVGTLGNVSGVAGQPSYEDGTRKLTTNSAGKDMGIVIAGFTEDYDGAAPDMGAFEYGTNDIVPYRPINVIADKYILDLSAGAKTVTITLNEGAELEYSVQKSAALNWLTVSENRGTLNAGTQKTITFTADRTKISHREGNALVLIRFSNGYSIPVSIFCSK